MQTQKSEKIILSNAILFLSSKKREYLFVDKKNMESYEMNKQDGHSITHNVGGNKSQEGTKLSSKNQVAKKKSTYKDTLANAINVEKSSL